MHQAMVWSKAADHHGAHRDGGNTRKRGGGGRKGRNSRNGLGGNRYMCVRVFVTQKTLTLAKKPHLTNKKYIRRSLKILFANLRPWIGKFAIGPKKSQPYLVVDCFSNIVRAGRIKKYHSRWYFGPKHVHNF
jgi:hypothetical protein